MIGLPKLSNLYHKSHFDLYINISNIQNSGYGVFTKTFIPKDTIIDEYFGEYTESLPGGEYFFRINNDGGINAIDLPRCYMAMLNDASYKPISKRALRKFVDHNYKNNCYFKVDEINKKVYVYSLCDILENSELFVSYGCDYWK
jgi:SET domain-containing protein